MCGIFTTVHTQVTDIAIFKMTQRLVSELLWLVVPSLASLLSFNSGAVRLSHTMFLLLSLSSRTVATQPKTRTSRVVSSSHKSGKHCLNIVYTVHTVPG